MPVKTGIQEFSKGFLYGFSWIPDQVGNDGFKRMKAMSIRKLIGGEYKL